MAQKKKRLGIILSEKEDIEFKQLVLLIVILLWLLGEHLYFEHWQAKFRVVRVIYWTFFCTIRIDIPDDPEGHDQYWQFSWKCIKVLFTDFLSMIFLVWAFGRTIM